MSEKPFWQEPKTCSELRDKLFNCEPQDHNLVIAATLIEILEEMRKK